MVRDVYERFYSKVAVDDIDKCWLWLAAKDDNLYGRFLYEGKNCRAHRVVWILTFGEITDDQVVMHNCDNTSCVNPYHLKLATQIVNIQDRVSKQRCFRPKGKLNSQAKLTEQQVKLIRKEFVTTHCTKSFLANKYNMSNSAVGRILNNKTWRS